MAVLRSEPDAAACRVCLSRLDEYVATQLADEDYVARFPDVVVHLDACPDCADAYAQLYELELAEAADRLPQPERLPDPDLSFLQPQASGPLSPAALQARLRTAALTERLRDALHRAGDRLTLQLSAKLLPLMRPSPAAAQTRAPADSERFNEVLLALEPDEELRPDLPVTLVVYRDAHHPGMCLVEVIVEPPGRSWPELEGIGVALLVAGERRKATTDAWGLAVFEGVPVAQLADMALEITL
jgi:hypothetical protein